MAKVGNVDENKTRGNWSSYVDFIISSIGCAVGLGNVWRFPYLARDNGGGAFLIPYFIMLVISGIPLFYLEIAIGQFTNRGPITIWNISPIFKGIGYAIILTNVLTTGYYNVILAWIFHYLFASMAPTLPWQNCNPSFADERCSDFFNVSSNSTYFESPTEQYWERVVLGVTKLKYLDANNSIYEMMQVDPSGNLGEIQWKLALYLLLSWIIIYFCIIGGVKTSGKVVYFTAIFPYVILAILLINNALLPGSLEGIKFFLRPDWEKLKLAQTWQRAASQIFYSLGVGFGSIITMASYNKFKNDFQRDTLIICLTNCATSIFAGFVIFSALGYMANKANVPIESVSKSGSAMAFIVYPAGITTMPVPQLWSILFFFMLFLLGIDTQFVSTEVIISAIIDEFPIFGLTKLRKMIFRVLVCLFHFFIGLPMVFERGIYLFTIFDDYAGSFILLVIGLAECLVVSYIYGFKNFALDIKMMLGKKPSYYWLVMWMGIAPTMIFAVLIFSFVQFAKSKYGNHYIAESYQALGISIITSYFAIILIIAIYKSIKRKWKMEEILKPEKSWGPGVESFWLEDSRYSSRLEESQKNNNTETLEMNVIY